MYNQHMYCNGKNITGMLRNKGNYEIWCFLCSSPTFDLKKKRVEEASSEISMITLGSIDIMLEIPDLQWVQSYKSQVVFNHLSFFLLQKGPHIQTSLVGKGSNFSIFMTVLFRICSTLFLCTYCERINVFTELFTFIFCLKRNRTFKLEFLRTLQ